MEESEEKSNVSGKMQQQKEKQPQATKQQTQPRLQKKQHIRARERRIARIKKYTLFSDTFMSVALKDIPACQHALRIMTGMPDLVVKEVRSQYRVSKIYSRDAILDILAEDGNGVLYNIEVQRKSALDHARRTRFYGAMIDSDFLQKGTDYDEMPEVRVIYISEKDIWKSGKTVYHMQKTLKGTNVVYEDGIHTTYINAEVDDRSEIAKLMKYFKTADPKDMSQGALSKRVHFLKCEEGGLKIMCDITEGFVREGMKQGMKKGKNEERKAGIQLLVESCQELGTSMEVAIMQLVTKYKLSQESAKACVTRYWRG